MTWNVEDTATMLQAIAGYDPSDPASSRLPVPDYSASLVEDIKSLKIGVPRHFFFAEDPQINREALAIVETALIALEDLGAHVEEITIPTLQCSQAAHTVIIFSEAFTYHRPNLLTRPEEYGVRARAQFRVGGLFSSSDYLQAQRVRNDLKGEFAQVLEKVDVIASPTRPSPAPRFDEVDKITIAGLVSFTSPYNMTGLPAISVPCGHTSDGLPVGLQIAARPFDEPTVLRTAFTYQQHARLFEQRPPV
jgi:aspartyl-tRNA(Asn)/glutamyl-tRNA(Gln) amidotransferase subunit A